MINKIIFWGLCATLVFVPLPFGLTEEWGILIFEVAIVLFFVLYLVDFQFFSRAKEVKVHGKRPKIPVLLKVLLICFLGVTVVQIIPIPHFLLKVFSPRTLEIYESVYQSGFNELGVEALRTLSFAPQLTLYEIIKYICYFLFGYLVFKYVKTKKEIEIFVLVLIICAVFQSFYGLMEYLGGTERIFGYEKEWGLGSASGSYINSNHFAGFLEMIFPISIGYLLARVNFFSMKKELSLREKILWFSQEGLQKSIILGTVSIIVGIGIVFSRSRSGISVFFLTFFMMIILISVGGSKQSAGISRGKSFQKTIRIVFLGVLLSTILIGIDPIIQKFSRVSLAKARRPVIFNDTVDLIESFPLFGTGAGTYVYAYTLKEKKYSPKITDHAHNDYLEFLAECGLVGGGILILFALGALVYVFIKWMRRRDYFVRGIGLGCIMGITALLIHSISDFNLHIPANAIYFVTLYALAFNTVNLRRC